MKLSASVCKHVLFLLLFILQQQQPTFAKKSYVVYMGAHSHGQEEVSEYDLHQVKESHYEFLGSYLGSRNDAKDAIFYSYTRHINGFAAVLEEEQALNIAKHPNVISVFQNKGKKLHTTRSWSFLGLEDEGEVPPSSIWEKARFGEDTIIANFDTEGGTVGFNYGRIADKLSSATQVVKLLKSHNIDRLKIYDADPAVLYALSHSNIKLTITLPNHQLRYVATRTSYAVVWVRRNVLHYHPHTFIEAIAVGNEVFADTHNTITFLVPAMKNIHYALVKYGLHSKIKVSSPIPLTALGSSYPYPSSAGSFRSDLIEPVFKPMLEFLRKTGSPLMVNVYPFIAYQSNSGVISLDYALFRDNPGVVDAGNAYRYMNLFDAQIDAAFAAMSALKYDDIPVIVTETGWPSKGGSSEIGASVENAAAYNGNLVRRILTGGGTPLRPKAKLTVFVSALFNENRKSGPTSERNYGLFYPTLKKVYDIPLTLAEVKRWKDIKGSAPPVVAMGPAAETGGDDKDSDHSGDDSKEGKGKNGEKGGDDNDTGAPSPGQTGGDGEKGT